MDFPLQRDVWVTAPSESALFWAVGNRESGVLSGVQARPAFCHTHCQGLQRTCSGKGP